MDKLKMRLFSDCFFYFQRYSTSTREYSKNEYWLKWKSLYELIEETGLIEEYKAFVESCSNKECL